LTWDLVLGFFALTTTLTFSLAMMELLSGQLEVNANYPMLPASVTVGPDQFLLPILGIADRAMLAGDTLVTTETFVTSFTPNFLRHLNLLSG
jgi:hypothetical protein